MKTTIKVRLVLLAALLASGGLEVVDWLAIPGVRGPVSTVQAVVGRPLTPVSVSGVARRTARRND
jgi:hypothetical protein